MNNSKIQGKNLPSWLFFDKGSRKFIGQVPQKEENITYEIMLKFLSGTNQITDKFSFNIYKNQGICALKLVGSIDAFYAAGIIMI